MARHREARLGWRLPRVILEASKFMTIGEDRAQRGWHAMISMVNLYYSLDGGAFIVLLGLATG